MKTLWAIILIFVLTDNLTGQNTRKNTFPIRITVCDSINHEPLFLATISLTQDNHKIIAGSSDAQGEYLFPSVQTGVYKLKVSFIGYKTYTDTIRITGDFSRHILLAPDQVVMQEVIVTARESHGMTSSSIIDRKAIVTGGTFSGSGPKSGKPDSVAGSRRRFFEFRLRCRFPRCRFFHQRYTDQYRSRYAVRQR